MTMTIDYDKTPYIYDCIANVSRDILCCCVIACLAWILETTPKQDKVWFYLSDDTSGTTNGK